MRAFKAILAVFLILGAQLQAETIQGALSLIARQPNTLGIPVGTIEGQAYDPTNPTYQYSLRACFDDTSWNCSSGNVINLTANWNCVSNACSTGTGASNNHWLINYNTMSVPLGGGTNPKDGFQHSLYVTQISSLGDTALNDIHVDWAWGLPVKWDASISNLAPTYTANTPTATPMTWANQAILVNSSDTFSTGTNTGNLVCTVSGTPIYDNGSAGYYIQQHGTGGTPCANVIVSTMTVSDTITVAAFNTAWQGKLNGLSGGIQYLNAAWMQPNIVVGATGSGGCQATGTQPCYGMAGWLTMYSSSNGVEPSWTSCIQRTYNEGQASYLNTWFNSGTNSSPFNSYAIRPAALLAAAKCTSGGCTTSNNYGATATWQANFTAWKAVVDAAKLAIGGNPTAIAQFPFISPGTHQELTLSPSVLGNAINSHITASIIGNSTTPTTAGVTSGTGPSNLLYFNDAPQWNYTSTFGFKAGSGFFLTASSYAGQLSASMGQTPVLSAMISDSNGGVHTGNPPAVMAGGTAVEPCEAINNKDMYPDLYLEYLAAGWTMGQSFWKSTQDPWIQNLWGDPMAQPYQPPIPGLGGTFTFGRRTLTGRGSTF